jgi:hypothetical protein
MLQSVDRDKEAEDFAPFKCLPDRKLDEDWMANPSLARPDLHLHQCRNTTLLGYRRQMQQNHKVPRCHLEGETPVRDHPPSPRATNTAIAVHAWYLGVVHRHLRYPCCWSTSNSGASQGAAVSVLALSPGCLGAIDPTRRVSCIHAMQVNSIAPISQASEEEAQSTQSRRRQVGFSARNGQPLVGALQR